MESAKLMEYTTDYIYALPEDERVELINGVPYDMAAPSPLHQEIAVRLSTSLVSYIDAKKGSCKVYPAPFAVFLNKDNRTYVEPDISVICDSDKINDKGCNGAPDFIIEIISPSTKNLDYGIKLFKYRNSGVREYWVVNPEYRTVNVYDFERDEKSDIYSFDDEISSCIYPDFTIRLADFVG